MEVDPEKIVLGVVVTVAVGFGLFILWGPVERRRKPGRIGGLVNLGFTCFLNTLLQALATCPSMLEWLSQQESTAGSLAQALKEVILVLNGQHPTIFDDPHAPSDVIRTLIRKGWVISPGEQDAHELFHVIMTTLIEETTPKITPVLSLSDALEAASVSFSKENICLKNIRSSSSAPEGAFNIMSSVKAFAVVSCPAFLPSLHAAPPFQGLLTSQLQCTACSYKSAVKYDKFDSLSLHLPNIFVTRLTLQHLLDKFVATEIVKDVSCEKCNKQQKDTNAIKVNAMKTLKFGKLPKCFCFHIQRTTWHRNGQAYKRYDYIEFPEYLSMDDYTFMHTQKHKVLTQEDGLNCDQTGNKSLPGSFGIKHLYKLSAVVVHVGSMESGHFVTFRRAPLRDNKWYYTSDCEVRESSLQEAMQASAYMLFYNKCTSTSISNGVRNPICDKLVL